MSPGNVEIARRLNEAFNSGDLSTWLELLDADILWCDRDDDPGATVCRGHEAVREHLVELAGDIAELRVEVIEFIERGEYVVTRVRVTGRGRASDAPFEEDEVHVVKVRDGRIVEFREYHDTAEAFRALGLDE